MGSATHQNHPRPIEQAMRAAIREAQRFVGATAPNPPVGAAALDASGNIIAVGAHIQAGTPHAEARVLEELKAQEKLSQLDTLVVTLEPCNHVGRTPPCSQAIVEAGIKRMVYGTQDPNPQVNGQGAAYLNSHGVDVLAGVLEEECKDLIRAFAHWITTGRPFVTLKVARTGEGPLEKTMLPPLGQKTFTSADSLKVAHELRKRADAILTGSGTILADQPLFTVRHVPDHPGKRRIIAILDRRAQVPDRWLEVAHQNGLEPFIYQDLKFAIQDLGSKGVLEVLIEAGPTLTQEILSLEVWDEQVIITQGAGPSTPDHIEIRRKQP